MFLVAKSRNRPFRLQVQPSLGLTYFQWSISDPHRFGGGSSTPETFHRSIRLQSMYTVDCKTPTGDRVISLNQDPGVQWTTNRSKKVDMLPCEIMWTAMDRVRASSSVILWIGK